MFQKRLFRYHLFELVLVWNDVRKKWEDTWQPMVSLVARDVEVTLACNPHVEYFAW